MTKNLHETYPWLKIKNTIEDYIKPSYYDKILKDYVFRGETDIQIFKRFLSKKDVNIKNTLELGCGTGRVTQAFLLSTKSKMQPSNLSCIDLSMRMLSFCRKKFSKFKRVEYESSDSINFLETTEKKYSLIFSLWSFSHSTHQILSKMGIRKGSDRIKKAIVKTVEENMNKGSYFYIIHFDSRSEEQKILIKQWARVYPIFKKTSLQSLGKLLLDEVLQELSATKKIKLNISHLQGDPIIYKDEENALETFLNFHLESYFNDIRLLPKVVFSLKRYFKKFTSNNSEVKIRPGCFIYEFKKI